MIYLHSSFQLGENVTLGQFQGVLDEMCADLRGLGLIGETGPICSRYRHPVMDTDEAGHDFFFVMTFESRDQCEKAVAYMYRDSGPGIQSHIDLQKLIIDPVFSCWEPASAPPSPRL